MTLQSQLIELPILGGVNQKEDAVLTRRPTAMTNCLYRKTGSVSKRYGMTCVGAYNLRSDATTPATCEMLTTYGDELVRVGGGKLDAFHAINSASDWVYRDRCPEVAVSKETIATVGRSASVFSDPDVAVSGGYSIAAYVSVTTAGATTHVQVCVDVTDTATGTRAMTRYVVATATTLLQAPRVAATGTTVGVFWYDVTAQKVRGRFLNLTTMAFGTAADAIDSVVSSKFDVACVSANEWAILTEQTSGTNRIRLGSVARTISGGKFDDVSAVYLSTTDTSLTAASLRYVAGERFWVAYAIYSGGNYNVKAATVTTGYVNGLAPTTVSDVVPSATYTVRSVGIEQVSSGVAIVNWSVDYGNAFWLEITSAGAYPFTPVNQLYKFGWLSRPFVRNGRAYALGFNVHSTHGTQFLVDLELAAIADNTIARYCAVALPRQLGGIDSNLNTIPRLNGLSNVATVGTDDYLVATVSSVIQEAATQVFTVLGLRLRFDAEWTRTAVESMTSLVLGGGVPSIYDGTQVFEAAFAHEPDPATVTLTAGSGGSLTSSTTYSYKFVFTYQDARGNVYRSAPSVAKTVALSGAQTSVSGNVPLLRLSNHSYGADAGAQVGVEIYRNVALGSTFYLVAVKTNRPDYATVTFTDTASDTTIALNRELYTTGDVLDHVAPPSATIAHVWKGAVFLAGTDDGKIWVSGEAVEDEGVWFNDTIAIAQFEGGEVTALSSLDACLVIFKERGIWYIQGDPPNNLGTSTLTTPTRIQGDIGCTDPRSVVQTPDGVYFRAEDGLYLLTRALQVVPVGKPVEDSYAAAGFVGAVSVPAQSLVRFVQASASYSALNLDSYHTAQFGSPVWSIDTYTDAIAVDAGDDDHAIPAAACSWRGVFTWISAAGHLFQEDTTTHLDTAGAFTSWVTMAFTTGVEKTAGVQGLQRVRRVSVLGKRITSHAATVAITVDGGGEQSRVWSAADVAALPGIPNETLAVHVARQKSQWLSVTVTDADPATSRGTGEGMTLRSIVLDVGVKRGLGAWFGAARKT